MKPQPKLIYGPYDRPMAAIGAEAICLVRGRVRIVGETATGVPWLTCRPLAGGGKAGPLVTLELRRAMENESMWAIAWGWGVSRSSVRRWRKALGIGFQTEGYWKALSEAGTANGFSTDRQPGFKRPASPDQMRKIRRLGIIARRKKSKEQGRPFSAEEDAMVGADMDHVIAEKLGRSTKSIASRRQKLGRPVVRNRLGHAEAARRGHAIRRQHRYAIGWPSLVDALRRAKMSISRLATWLGIGQSTIRYQQKNGKIMWRHEWIIEAGKILNVDTARLYE